MNNLHNIGVEQALLGTLIIVPDEIDPVIDKLKPEHFSSLAHQRIYETLVALFMEGATVETLTIEERLKKRYNDSYHEQVLACIDWFGTASTTVEEYAEIIISYYMRRMLVMAGERLAKAGLNQTTSADEAMTLIDEQVNSVMAAIYNTGHNETAGVDRIGLEYLDAIDRAANGEMPDIIPTGIPFLDDAFDGGFTRGSLSFIFARPGQGKTILSSWMALNAAMNQYKVLYFSLEMTHQEMMNRLVTATSRMQFSLKPRFLQMMDTPLPAPVRDIYEKSIVYKALGNKPKTKREAIISATGYISSLPFMINDRSSHNLATIRAISSRYAPDMIVVDHAVLLEGAGDMKVMNDYAVGFKALAKDTDAAVLIVTQAKREAEMRDRLEMSDMYWGGEQPAQRVIGVRLEKREDVSVMRAFEGLEVDAVTMWVLKNRDGEREGKEMIPVALSTGTVFPYPLAVDTIHNDY